MTDKNRRYGIIGTVIFHSLLLLLLIFFGLKSIPQEEEGILVNFGDTVTALGDKEPRPSVSEKVVETPPPPPAKKPEPVKEEPAKEEIKTQDYDKAPEVKSAEQKKKDAEEKKRKEEERKKQEELDQQKEIERQKELERQKEIERQQEIQRQKEEEARKKREVQEKQAADARNKVSGAFGKKPDGSDGSEGDTKGTGNQGHLTGDPDSKNRTGSGLGNSGSGFDLTGRNLIGGLPKPHYNIQEEGIVVVEITVDRNGNVIAAVPILRGSTTQNNYLQAKAVEAAKKAKFNTDKNAAAHQKGKITYHFVLD
ncbi:MAG: TonB family protein [Marinilabiliaceae bacterium]|nr:TonB family protein [Marinilabiliaceae bacterium]